ncbi:SDR family oxidoreductase [Rhodococcus globerulus]|uniref:SDR family oxidoreductase n=1 Tax=Rhodococcus globerulus TaxID=33008 RepID=UPI003AFB61C4
MSGGSRGIGLAIALRAAQDGANVALLAKTGVSHPTLEGTIHTAVDKIRSAGGRALAIVGDVRNETDVDAAVAQTVSQFGGIDIVVNNASAIDLSTTTNLPMKKYDLMQDINTRGAFLLAKTALPHLSESNSAQILSLSPPLNLNPYWAGVHLGYTISKYGMSLVTLGLAAELADHHIGVNSLWPRTTIATAAVDNILGGPDMLARSRTPAIMADAAHIILTRDPQRCTGNFFIDDEVLAEEGIDDLSPYGGPADELEIDIFLGTR